MLFRSVDVVDPVLEVPEEADRIDVLPDHVARVPVEPEVPELNGMCGKKKKTKERNIV